MMGSSADPPKRNLCLPIRLSGDGGSYVVTDSR